MAVLGDGSEIPLNPKSESQLRQAFAASRRGIEGLDTRVTAAESDIDDLETDAAALEIRVSEAETDIDDLEAADVVHDSRLDTAEGDIDAIEADYVSAENAFATDERVLVSDGVDRGAKASSIPAADVVASGSDIGTNQIVAGIGVGRQVTASGLATTTVQNAILDIGTLQDISLYDPSEAYTAAGFLIATNSNVDLETVETTITAASVTNLVSNAVTAASAFGTDNFVLRSDGTGRGSQPCENGSGFMEYTDAGTLVLRSPADPVNLTTWVNAAGTTVGSLRTTSAGNFAFSANSLLQFLVAGTNYVHIAAGAVDTRNAIFVHNESGGDFDFRVEGDTLTHMIFVEANAASENIALLAGAVPNWQSMDGGLFIANSTTIPSGDPVGGGFLYVEGGALKWRGSSGTVTTIAPA